MLKEDQKKSVNKHKGGKPTTKMDLFLEKAWLFHICVYTPGVRLPPPCWSCVSHWQGARLTRWLKGCLERTGSTLCGVFDPPLSMWQHDSGRNRYWNLFFCSECSGRNSWIWMVHPFEANDLSIAQMTSISWSECSSWGRGTGGYGRLLPAIQDDVCLFACLCVGACVFWMV